MSGDVRVRREWSSASLGDVVRNIRGRVLPSEQPHLPFVGMDNVESQTMRLLGTSNATSMKSAAIHFESGDVLYGRLRPYLNKVFTADFNGLASAEFIPLSALPGIVPKFVQYRLNSADFVSYTSGLDTGDRPRVDFEQIGAFQLEVPPTREQHRIVEAVESHLTRLDEAVASLERVQRNLKRYRASVLKSAVEGRLVPTEAELARAERRDYEPASELLKRIIVERRRLWNGLGSTGVYSEPESADFSNCPELPEGWCWTTLEHLASRVTKGSSPNWQGFDYTETGIAFVRSQNVRWGRLELEDLAHLPSSFNEKEPRSVLRRDDVLLNIVGASIGRAAVVDHRVAGGNTNQAVAVIRLVPGGLQPLLACLYLVSPGAQRVIQRAKVDVARANLSLADVARLPIPLAPAAEQARIVVEAERLASFTGAWGLSATDTAAKAARLRQSILKWAFEGRLVDQDPNDEPASVLLESIKAERAAAPPATRNRRAYARVGRKP